MVHVGLIYLCLTESPTVMITNIPTLDVGLTVQKELALYSNIYIPRLLQLLAQRTTSML